MHIETTSNFTCNSFFNSFITFKSKNNLALLLGHSMQNYTLKKKNSHLLQKVFVALSEDRRQRQYYLHFKRHCLCVLSSFFVRCFYWANTHRIENVFFFLLFCCIFVSKAGSTLIFMKSVET